MADNTPIEWTDATWNPITGCSVVSPGCRVCYAMKLAGTRLKHVASRKGLTRETKAGPVWTGEVRFNEAELVKPLSWRRPRKIFVCAHGDLFAENVPDEWIDRVFAVMALAPQHTFQVLTKRSARMREYLGKSCGRIADTLMALRKARGDRDMVLAPLPHIRAGQAWWPLPNVWLGVSAEDQRRAQERVPDLLATPAAIRFVSAEPLLGPIDFREGLLLSPEGKPLFFFPPRDHLDWIIVGGESGNGARPMHPDWARQIRDACAAAGVAFFFKQWGAWLHESQGPFYPPASWFDSEGKPRGPNWHFWTDGDRGADASVRVGKKRAGRLLDGIEHNAIPAIGQAR